MRASPRACCAARAARCRSATSSRGSRSSSRSARTGGSSCTGASSRRSRVRRRARRRTPPSSHITRMPRAMPWLRCGYATAAGGPAASQGAHREAAAQYARAAALRREPAARRARRAARAACAGVLPHESDRRRPPPRRSVRSSATAQLGDRRSEAAALCALSEHDLVPGGHRRVRERRPRGGRSARRPRAGTGARARVYHNLATLAESPDDGDRRWALRAGALAERARRPSDRVCAPASRSMPCAITTAATARRGAGSSESLELAVAGGFELEAGSHLVPARAGPRCVTARYADVDRYVEDGLAHSGQCDLEVYERYLRAFGARAALDRGRWGDATDAANIVLHDPGPSIVPLVCANVVARARACAARATPGVGRVAGARRARSPSGTSRASRSPRRRLPGPSSHGSRGGRMQSKA